MNKYRLLILKRRLENIIIFPFVITGRIIALCRPLKKEYRVFFFFPFYHTGGAEIFNMRLTHAVGGKDTIVFFTRKSVNNRFYSDFEQSGCTLKDISRYTDNKWLYFLNLIFRGIITGYINSQKNRPIIFNGQCNFGYKISPWVNKHIIQLEFIHTFCSFSYIRVPFLPYYTQTISSSEKTITDHKLFYNKWKIPAGYSERFRYILYGIELPSQKRQLLPITEFTVLFVGRGSPEKRVHIVAALAKETKAADDAVQFWFMGDVSGSVPEHLHAYCHFLGNQSDPAKIHEIYTMAHVLIITSAFEGFPLVVMEAMSRGLAVISTPVGDVPRHVKNGIHGFIIEELENEEIIIREALKYILALKKNTELLQKIAEENIRYAEENFGLPVFNSNYRHLFEEFQSN